MRLSCLAALAQAPVEESQPQDPGWSAVLPGLIFLVLAAVVWWIWRRLADSD